MPHCFAPECNHSKVSHYCSFFTFPSATKKAYLRRSWIAACRRADREVKYYDRLCSCHFKNGIKVNGPSIFSWNKDKTHALIESPMKIRKSKKKQLQDEEDVAQHEEVAATSSQEHQASSSEPQHISVEPFHRLTFDQVKANPTIFRHYTGLPNVDIFNVILETCSRFEYTYFLGWSVDAIPPEDQLLLCLMKLRRGSTSTDLAFRFNISGRTVQNIFVTWLDVLHHIFFVGMLKYNGIPSVDKNGVCLPDSFSSFAKTRVVLDCTEIPVCSTSSMEVKKEIFSHYKHKNTLKGLIGVSPNGVVTFISDLFPGSTSDRQIVRLSGIVTQLKAGDTILADKGFRLSGILPPGVNLNVPPFLHKEQLTQAEAILTRLIARARVHVERAIGRLKNFRILDNITPNLRPHASKIFQVCGTLVNFQSSLFKDEEEGQD